MAAYACDKLFIFAIVFFTLYLVVRSRIDSRIVCVTISLSTSAVFYIISALFDKKRLDKHIVKLRIAAKRDIRKRKLALLDEKEYCNAIFADDTPLIYPVSSAECVTADDVRRAYRKAIEAKRDKVLLIAYAKPTESAQMLVKSLYGMVVITTPFEYLDGKYVNSIEITEDEIDHELISRYYPDKPSGGLLKRLKLFTRERAIRYLGVGMLLFICSIFMRYSLYFRILSTVCLSVGGALLIGQSIRAGREPNKEESDAQ